MMGLLDEALELDEDELTPPVVEIPATRCACQDCKDRVENPVAYWDRITDKIVRETA